jgi:putative MATE family efflux protein
MVLGNFLQNLFNLVEMFYVGKLGPEAIAAVSIGGLVIDVLWTFITGVGLGFRALIARAAGAKKFDEATHVAHQAILLALLVSVPLAAVGGLFARPITILLGAEPSVAPAATVYFRIVILSASLFLLTHGASGILNALGEAKIPTRAMLLITLLTVTMEPILIFGLGPLPPLAVTGAAWSLVLCYLAASVYLFGVLFRGYGGVKISFTSLRMDGRVLWKIVKIGLPRAFQRSFRAITAIAMVRIVAGYGTKTLAAYGVAMRIYILVLSPGWGMSGVASTLVGQNLGAQRPERAEKSAWAASLLYGSILFFLTAAFFLFGQEIVSLFNQDPEVVGHATRLLRITSPFYVFLALAMVLGGALGGSGDTVPPMVITAISLSGIQVGAALVLPGLFGLRENGLWLAISCGLTAWGSATALWFRLGYWKEKVL